MDKIIFTLTLLLMQAFVFAQTKEQKLFWEGTENLYAIGQVNENGEKTNEWKYYYPNGELQMVGNYENDKTIGEWRWYEFGKLATIGNYKGGRFSGEWKKFHPDGTVREIRYYDANAQETGIWKTYRGNGKLELIGKYKNGKKTGNWKHYNEQGKLIKTEKY